MGWEGLDWIDIAQVSGKWRARVNTVIKLLGSIKCGKVPNNVNGELIVFQAGLGSI